MMFNLVVILWIVIFVFLKQYHFTEVESVTISPRQKFEYIRSTKGLAYKTQTLSHSYHTHGRQISKEISNRSVQKRLCVEWDGSKKKDSSKGRCTLNTQIRQSM